MSSNDEDEELQKEIASLEVQLQHAKSRLTHSKNRVIPISNSAAPNGHASDELATSAISTSPDDVLHTLILLADSQLPIGSFAFSSGLESFLAHRRHLPNSTVDQRSRQFTSVDEFVKFLHLSLLSTASLSIPYVTAAYRSPHSLLQLDDECDATTTCGVARRASTSQGRALVSVWDRSFSPVLKSSASTGKIHHSHEAEEALRKLSDALRAPSKSAVSSVAEHEIIIPKAHGHFAPAWGAVTRSMSVSEASSAYTFLFSHARAVVSAAVRASVLGPYQAQSELARPELKEAIESLVKRFKDVKTEDVAQRVPTVDLWVGRHDKLYSRIFNS
jgi:urease accessory protein